MARLNIRRMDLWDLPEREKTYLDSIQVDRKSLEMSLVSVFTKDDYQRIVREHRKAFIHQHFQTYLIEFFKQLKDDAGKMKGCHREVVIDVPEHFDLDKTEAMLCDYFADLGFRPLKEPRKGDSGSKITITIT